MAFELPSHLPRHAFTGREQSLGSSSNYYDSFLAKLDEVPAEKLDSALTSSWVRELTAEVEATKSAIRSSVTTNLPDFERQLATSRDVVARVGALASGSQTLSNALLDRKDGLLPVVSSRLNAHVDLYQRTMDAEILSRATAHAVSCRTSLAQLTELVSRSKLVEATALAAQLEELVRNAPDPLPKAKIFVAIKSRLRALSDSTQEQLEHAKAQAIRYESSKNSESITLTPQVQLASQSITLSEILSSLQPDSASRAISSLSKTLLRLVDPVLSSSGSISTSDSTITLTLHVPFTSTTDQLTLLVTFIRDTILPHLPALHAQALTRSTLPSITQSLLAHLKQTIPSSLEALPAFIQLVSKAVEFEELAHSVLVSSGSGTQLERSIKTWADALPSHYEKKRREVILQNVREVVLDDSRLGSVRVRMSVKRPVNGPELVVSDDGASERQVADSLTMNGNEHSGPSSVPSSSSPLPTPPAPAPAEEEEEDGWGFEDLDNDDAAVVESSLSASASASEPEESPVEVPPSAHPQLKDEEAEADPWADDLDDDPWGEPDEPTPPPAPAPVLAPVAAPKQAKGLAKFSSKGRAETSTPSPASSTFALPSSGSMSGSVLSLKSKPAPVFGQHHSYVQSGSSTPSLNVSSPVSIEPPVVEVKQEEETFLVSELAQAILGLLRGSMNEAEELARSSIFPPSTSSPFSPGSILTTSLPSSIDLFRSLVPVAQAEMMALSPALRIRFYNDCLYLAQQIEQLSEGMKGREDGIGGKLSESSERLEKVGEVWLDECLDSQKHEVMTILSRTNGLLGTGDDTQYATDQSIIDHVIQTLNTFAHDWKETLAPSAYMDACGYIVDATLSSVLNNILSLPDIPEAESHRLNALCKRLELVTDLFVPRGGKESQIGAYVPSWFKFAYLSELLEASLADISDLFSSGALIDFEREELVRLVQGLFSNTPLRAKTINKIRTEEPGVGGI